MYFSIHRERGGEGREREGERGGRGGGEGREREGISTTDNRRFYQSYAFIGHREAQFENGADRCISHVSDTIQIQILPQTMREGKRKPFRAVKPLACFPENILVFP